MLEENCIWYVYGGGGRLWWKKWISSIVLLVVEGFDSVREIPHKFDDDNMMAAFDSAVNVAFSVWPIAKK